MSRKKSLAHDLRFAFFLYRKDERVTGSFLLLILSLAFGVAALVSLDIFTRRIGETINRDSKALMAADYQVTARRPFTEPVRGALKEEYARGDVIEQNDFVSSLAYGTDSALTVSVRALEGKAYPFYGIFETRPQTPIESLRAEPRAIIDQSFEARGVKIGDRVRLGTLEFTVAAYLVQEPESVAGAFALGPRVIIHRAWADQTGLTGRGARVFNQLLVRSPLDIETFKKKFRAGAPEPHWRLVTPVEANRQAERIIGRIRGFLSFVGLTGLFLGGVGLFMIFRSQFLLKLMQFLTLRCLGVSRRALYCFALIRAVGVGVAGCVIGSFLGFQLERAIMGYARANMDVSLAAVNPLPSFLYGGLLALGVGIVAAVFPLSEILRVPVSQAIRQDESQQFRFRLRDGIVLALLSIGLTLVVNQDVKLTFVFLGGLVAAVLLLLGIGALIARLLVPFSRLGRAFVPRHALLSILRKPARSQLLLVSLGVGLFLLESVIWIAVSLRQQLDVANREGIPNIYFLNVAEADLPTLKEIVPDASTVPITQARLTELEERAVTTENVEQLDGGERFYQTREYFITRRAAPSVGERILQSIDGKSMFGPKPDGDLVRASIEASFAENVHLKVGSTLRMDIAGVPVQVRVDSLRSVDWFNFQPNFFIVLNESDLADAPMDYVAFGRVDRSRISEVQRAMGARVPQVSVLDGDALGRRLSDLLKKLSFSVFSLSLFSLGSCVFVFVGMTMARVREFKKDIALWKCLGVTAGRIRGLFVLESVALVLAASSAALVAATLAVTAVCRFALEIPVENPGAWFFVLAVLAAPVLFTALALVLSRSLVGMNPARIWRELEA